MPTVTVVRSAVRRRSITAALNPYFVEAVVLTADELGRARAADTRIVTPR